MLSPFPLPSPETLRGFPEGTYDLVHRRGALADGCLGDYGVGPGACILLKQNGIVQI